MHYRGFVFVSELTQQALAEAMDPHKEEWDWWRPGGRWDGYLVSDEEMTRREADGGFNFSAENESLERNSVRAVELNSGRKDVYFFVADGKWVAREYWNGDAPSKWHEGERGAFEDNPEFSAGLDAALDADPNRWVVVVDIHN